MKKIYLIAGLLFSLTALTLSAQSSKSDWTERKAKKWFKKKEYLNGLSVTPHSATDKVLFAQQYHLNKTLWDKALAYLKQTNLQALANGRHAIDGDNVYALLTQAPSKDYDKTAFESHRRYIYLQCVITGEENMAKTQLSSVTISKPYNESTDLAKLHRQR